MNMMPIYEARGREVWVRIVAQDGRVLDERRHFLTVHPDTFAILQPEEQATAIATMLNDNQPRREFVLHDGTDEKKTEELHEFLDGIDDWEGDNGGITISPTYVVRIGDKIVRRGHSIEVVKKEK